MPQTAVSRTQGADPQGESAALRGRLLLSRPQAKTFIAIRLRKHLTAEAGQLSAYRKPTKKSSAKAVIRLVWLLSAS